MTMCENQPVAEAVRRVPLETLELWRDSVTLRIERLCREQDRQVVEGFYYADPVRAIRVRGRLMCSLLRRVDMLNRAICAQVAPNFAPVASEGFSDHVMTELS